MRKLGLIKKGKIGFAKVIVIKMEDCRKIIEKYLKGEIKGYGCKNCNIRSRNVSETVESDWDTINNKFKSDTTAYTGDYLN